MYLKKAVLKEKEEQAEKREERREKREEIRVSSHPLPSYNTYLFPRKPLLWVV
jgi:hypothetical protein